MKTKVSKMDKVMFPVMNTMMVVLVFVVLKSLFTPSTALEYVAILLMCALSATPIANAHRKEILEHNEINELLKEERNPLRKSA